MTHVKECKLRLEKIIQEHIGEDINKKTRKREVIHLRTMAYKIMLKEQCLPSHIAQVFGMHHATVLHHLKDFEYLYENVQDFSNTYNHLQRLYFDVEEEPVKKEKKIVKREMNPLYDIVDKIPVTERDNVRVRLEAMIAGFNIRPKGYNGKIYQSNLTTIE
jgi:hypothetical protein